MQALAGRTSNNEHSRNVTAMCEQHRGTSNTSEAGASSTCEEREDPRQGNAPSPKSDERHRPNDADVLESTRRYLGCVRAKYHKNRHKL